MFNRLFIIILAITGLILAIITQEGNIITAISGLAVFILGIVYFIKFDYNFIQQISSALKDKPYIKLLQEKTKLILKKIPNFKNLDTNEKIKSISSYIFLFSLFLITFLSLNFNFIKETFFLSTLQEFLKQNSTFFTALAIIFGCFTSYLNRKKINQDIEEDENKEEQEEEKRKNEFPTKFPKVNKIPILRNIVKWMYKEGWAFSIPLLIIALIFIVIKIGMPIVYTGSYIDEYNHILSGIEFFETSHFAEIYHGSYYTRGAHVSVLVGFLMFLFGQTIFVAKMLPATLGIICFFLLYKISKNVFTNKNYILLLLGVYTLIPWFIFNHFYIRMYVFYEFFILFLTLLFILIIQNIKNIKNLSIYGGITLISLAIIYFFSNDSGMYMVLLYALFFIIYIFFFEIQSIPIKNKIYQFISNNLILKASFLFTFLLCVFLYFDGLDLFNRLILGSVQFSSGMDYKYDNLFFNLNHPFTIFFLLSPIIIFLKKINIYIKLIIFSSLILFFLHLNSSSDLQMTRVIIYFLPLFYLISISVFSRIPIVYKNKFIFVSVLLLLGLSIYANYPNNFFLKGPYIPSEIRYKDYKKTTNYLLKNYNKNFKVVTHIPHMILFYDNKGIIKKENIFLLRDKKGAFHISSLKYKKGNNIFYTASDSIVITESMMLKNLIIENDVILVLDNGFYNSWTSIESQELIKSKFKKQEEFKELTVYKKK